MPSDHSSGAPGKRVRRAIAAHRLRSPRIAIPIARPGRLTEPLSDLVGIEAKAWATAAAEAARAELVGVVIDPAAANAPPLCDLLGGDELGARPRRLARCQQVGEAVRQCLDRLGIEAKLSSRAAHLFLPKGARRTFGLLGHRSAWWAMRAWAISI
ncbi:MAG TPA: hypothetical protein VLK56_07835 [Solirubrobacterales bacterium]|nr:hypothetical protein [Solirubrobacterales bacterium]